MRVLILGGTGFIGPAFVQAAVARGHDVAVFNRGRSDADLPAVVERLIGDRTGDLAVIADREWDAVFDLATFIPGSVRSLGEALSGRAGHYTFISTISVYRFPGATDEDSDLLPYLGELDPYAATAADSGAYGPLKALCEAEGERQFPGRALILRPGHIVGPREGAGAFTFLAARMAAGGEVLAAGDPLTQVQLIDARDLAEWAVRMAEQRAVGTFTAVGPARALGWAELLDAVRGAFAVETELVWVPLDWVAARGIDPFSALLFWASELGFPGFTRLDNARAVENGLTFRPLAETARDTVAWFQSLSPERQREAVLRLDAGTRGVAETATREAGLLAAWRAEVNRP